MPWKLGGSCIGCGFSTELVARSLGSGFFTVLSTLFTTSFTLTFSLRIGYRGTENKQVILNTCLVVTHILLYISLIKKSVGKKQHDKIHRPR